MSETESNLEGRTRRDFFRLWGIGGQYRDVPATPDTPQEPTPETDTAPEEPETPQDEEQGEGKTRRHLLTEAVSLAAGVATAGYTWKNIDNITGWKAAKEGAARATKRFYGEELEPKVDLSYTDQVIEGVKAATFEVAERSGNTIKDAALSIPRKIIREVSLAGYALTAIMKARMGGLQDKELRQYLNDEKKLEELIPQDEALRSRLYSKFGKARGEKLYQNMKPELGKLKAKIAKDQEKIRLDRKRIESKKESAEEEKQKARKAVDDEVARRQRELPALKEAREEAIKKRLEAEWKKLTPWQRWRKGSEYQRKYTNRAIKSGLSRLEQETENAIKALKRGLGPTLEKIQNESGKAVRRILLDMMDRIKKSGGDYARLGGHEAESTILFTTPGKVKEEDVHTYIGAWRQLTGKKKSVTVAHMEYKGAIKQAVEEAVAPWKELLKEEYGLTREQLSVAFDPKDRSANGVDTLEGDILSVITPSSLRRRNFVDPDLNIFKAETERELVEAVYFTGGRRHIFPLDVKVYSTTALLSEKVLKQLDEESKSQTIYLVPNGKFDSGEVKKWQTRLGKGNITEDDYIKMLQNLGVKKFEGLHYLDNKIAGVQLAELTFDKKKGMGYENSGITARRVSHSYDAPTHLRFVDEKSVAYLTKNIGNDLKNNTDLDTKIDTLQQQIKTSYESDPLASQEETERDLVQLLGTKITYVAVNDKAAAAQAMESYDATQGDIVSYLNGQEGITANLITLESLKEYGKPQRTSMKGTVDESMEFDENQLDTSQQALIAGLVGGIVYLGVRTGIRLSTAVATGTAKLGWKVAKKSASGGML